MKALTKELWEQQDRHKGDRLRLFSTVASVVDAHKVLYPGCFVDISPSFVFPNVTYIDLDTRVPKFFSDKAGILEIIAGHKEASSESTVTYIHGDYQLPLGLKPGYFDLLISLYAGFISEHCTEYLRIGGVLLVNPSHGDAAMASIDPRYELIGVVTSRNLDYRVSTSNLSAYLVPKKPVTVTADLLHQRGRGIAYTKSPFSYLFRRTC